GRPLCNGPVLRRLHYESAASGSDEPAGVDRFPIRQPRSSARTRRPGPAPCASSLLVEERQMGAGYQAFGSGQAWILGKPRLSRLRGPRAGASLSGRLMWRAGTVLTLHDERVTARTITLTVPGWPGHLAGHHVDVRLTAADGYSAVRSYSIASAPNREDRVE